jgi:hypothetical protein
MEALILAMIIAYAVKKAAEGAHNHWQGSKAANRAASRGKPVSWRARSAARHDAGYWAHQVRGGFPEITHGLYMGWHSGRIAQLDGAAARAAAKAEHVQTRARVAEAIREQRRRQAEALDRIRAAAAASLEPEADPGPDETEATVTPPPGLRTRWPGPDDDIAPVTPTPTTEGNTMSGDTTYTQQMSELEAIRRDAEAEVNDVRRKRMVSRLDILMSLGLDPDSLSEAAGIDDALRAQEKAAQQTLDAADAAISGLKQRHGGIKGAVDDSPVDKPADPEFYTD